MIKFFRHIRKSLIEKNQMGKYFKYAIGEIILVTIGILIALQINNWNENRIQDEKTKGLLVRLLKETEANQNTLISNLKLYKKIKETNTTFLNLFGTNVKEVNNTKLDSLFLNSAFDFTLGITSNSLKEAMDNGQVSTIKSEELRSRLYQFVFLEEYVRERINLYNYDSNNFLMPFLYKNMNLRSINSGNFSKQYEKLLPSKMKNTDYNSLLNNREFENLVNSKFAYTNELMINIKMLQRFLSLIKNLLEEELKNYK
tara:strand:+ start:3134 stop:3904 length:771 start_codon:yes stop_codon:yes gene_type:complete